MAEKKNKVTEPKERRLTVKQEKFCQLVASGLSNAEAYKQAYERFDWSSGMLKVQGYKNMDVNAIRQRVEELKGEYAKELIDNKKSDLDEILTMMTNRVRLDPRGLYNDDGSLKDMKDLTLEQAQNIAEITTQEIFDGQGADRVQIGRVVKIKLIDLKGIFDSFLKTFGAYIEKRTHSIDTGDLDYIREMLHDLNDK